VKREATSLRLALIERDRRRQAEASRFAAWRDKPAAFVAEVLGEFLWSKQIEIAEALIGHRKVAVQSCHGPGKSFIGARIVDWFIATAVPGEARAITTAPTGDQVRGVLWHEINTAHTKGRLPGRTTQTEWWIGKFLAALGRKPSDYAPIAFQGYHAKRLLVLIDEACGVPLSLWIAADSLLTTEESRILAIGNPDDPASQFATVCKPGSGWHVIRINAFDTPNFTGEEVPDAIRPLLTSRIWVEDKRKSWGEASPLWQSKVLGLFPDVGDDTLIPPGWLRAAVDRYAETQDDPEAEVELGCDIARFGMDETVIIMRRGIRARIYATLHQRDLMTVTGTIVRAIKDTGARRCKIDDAGLGGGVTDRLLELVSEREFAGQDVEIIPINVGTAATEGDEPRSTQERFRNLKAEISWALRDRFETGDIAIEEDEDLLGQTAVIKYKLTSRGQIEIERKEDIKKRGLPSPDRFDALVLAFAPRTSRSLRAWESLLENR
jgi:hypothetical protein